MTLPQTISSTKVLPENIEKVLIQGDLQPLNPEQRLAYYKAVCDSVGLNTLTKPFEYINLNGKLVLYATKAAAEQLRQIHNVSIEITSREKIDEVYVVTAKASMPDGRKDESTGAVLIGGLRPSDVPNAFMKAETKAKRRATLSICGLGLLDESEVVDAVNAETATQVKTEPVDNGSAITRNTLGELSQSITRSEWGRDKAGIYAMKRWGVENATLLTEFQAREFMTVLTFKKFDQAYAELENKK